MLTNSRNTNPFTRPPLQQEDILINLLNYFECSKAKLLSKREILQNLDEMSRRNGFPGFDAQIADNFFGQMQIKGRQFTLSDLSVTF